MLSSQSVEKEHNSAVSMEELLIDFEKTLIDTLKAPEKNVIGNLTGMVDGYLSRKDSAAICPNICKIIERRLNEAQVGRKLAHLYLLDSIVKNLKTSQYPKLFGANLVQSFSGVFRKGDEKMRKKLFELRKTWNEHFSQQVLHSLDLAVREIDPAWPMLAAPPPGQQQPNGNTARKRCHSPDSPDSTTSHQQQAAAAAAAAASGGDSSSSSRKRMSVAGGDFVIDTVGDSKAVEALASARTGRPQQSANSRTAAKPSDVDMRSGWNQFRRVQSGSGDVDMRQFQTDDSATPEMMRSQAAQIRRMLGSSSGGSLRPEVRQQLTSCLRTLESELAAMGGQQQQPAQVPQTSASSSGSQIPQHVDSLLDALLGTAGQHQPTQPTTAPIQQQVGLPHPRSLPSMPPSNRHRQQPMEPVFHDLFRWRVTVPDMPEFPQIGCDPRLLSPMRDRFEASRNIQIDGELRQVVLDRVQPLLILDEQPRALRFKMPPGGKILLRIDSHQPVELKINACTKVLFGLRPHLVCLGGPFHELIVHGRPYNVPFNDSNPVIISLGGSAQFGIRLQAILANGRAVTPSLDICPPIPRSVMRWANEGAFGSPQHLHLPPLNPELNASQHHQQQQQPDTAQQSQPVPQAAQQQPPPQQSVPTVFEVFENLIKHGIIKKTNAEDLPEPDLTSFEGIDKPLPMIPKRLYEGYQCPQCGLRFNSEQAPECRDHMDWHYQRRAALFGVTIRSRMWFPHWTALVKGEDPAELAAAAAAAAAAVAAAAKAAATNSKSRSGKAQKSSLDFTARKEQQQQQQQQVSRVSAYPEPERNVCGVCFETFENRWDDDAEDWMLLDCVRLPDGGIYHPVCAEDAGKVRVDDDEADVKKEDIADQEDSTPSELLTNPAAALLSILNGRNQPASPCAAAAADADSKMSADAVSVKSEIKTDDDDDDNVGPSVGRLVDHEAEIGHDTSADDEHRESVAVGHDTSAEDEHQESVAVGHDTSADDEHLESVAVGHDTSSADDEHLESVAVGHDTSSADDEHRESVAVGHDTSSADDEHLESVAVDPDSVDVDLVASAEANNDDN